MKVLVVEQDRSSRDGLVNLLQKMDFDTTEAASVRGALKNLKDRPEVAIIDMSLPDGHGLKIMRHIRSQHLPVRLAVVSGGEGQMRLADVQECRPEAIFGKPIDLADIADWLKGVSDVSAVAA